MNKNSYSYRSSAETRKKNNPYAPFENYRDYNSWLLIFTVELNEMVSGIPASLISEVWIHDVRFRQIFRKVVTMAAYIHHENTIQKLLPWCYVDIKEYAKRFEGVTGEELLKMMKK